MQGGIVGGDLLSMLRGVNIFETYFLMIILL